VLPRNVTQELGIDPVRGAILLSPTTGAAQHITDIPSHCRHSVARRAWVR
jgi:hypothetical protein